MDDLQNVKLENINIPQIKANILFMLFSSWTTCHINTDYSMLNWKKKFEQNKANRTIYWEIGGKKNELSFNTI